MSIDSILAGRFIVNALDFIRSQQLTTGEILCRDAAGPYTSCPLASALAYDALGCVDTKQTREFAPVVAPTVSMMRWRLRSYIGWEEESDSTWRFHGHQSNLPPDPTTTMCAAVVLLQGRRKQNAQSSRRHFQSLARFAKQGRLDRTATAHALRFMGLAGANTSSLQRAVWEQMEAPQTILSAHAIAAAWRQAGLTGRDAVAAQLTPAILSLDPRNRLEQALAVSALLDLGYTGPMLSRYAAQVVSSPMPAAGWPFDAYGMEGIASAGVTLAVTLANFIRIIACA
jgi:hypothetical protein